MAQAVFDDHPIEQYLRDSGEVPELMPGGAVEFSRESSHDLYHTSILRLQSFIRLLRNRVSHVLESTGLRSYSPASEFAERFKYIVISSSLLASSLTSAPPHRALTPTTPGHYEHRTSLSAGKAPIMTEAPSSLSMPLLALSLACLIPAAMIQGYYISSVLVVIVVKLFSGGGLSLSETLSSSPGEESWSSTLENLSALVSVNDAWDAVFSEALSILEDEERNAFHPTTPSSHSSPLRIALSSSLHTTQSQCDDVRQLLSALTSPVLLSQLSEMYAPPSPSPLHTFSSQSLHTRPASLAVPPLHRSRSYTPIQSTSENPGDDHTRNRTSSAPIDFSTGKRSTWNGSYLSLAGSAPRRQKHRPNLSTIIRQEILHSPTYQNAKGSSSVPPTPSLSLGDPDPTAADADAEEEPFGISALDLHRKGRSTRPPLSPELPLSSRSPFAPPPLSISQGNHKSPLSSSFGSHFTTLNPTTSSSRHTPLSLSNLRLSLHGALAAKRFACSHLLALRFSDPQHHDSADEDGEDESYWEDVRSVMSLLASTLEDASARLGEALADTMQEACATDEELSVPISPEPSRRPLSVFEPQTFAPTPNHLSRFAAHIDAISAALSDAREHLQATVSALRETGGDTVEAASVSYERLRRELGLALRECERGRGILVELVQRGSASGVDGEEDDLPARNDEHCSSGDSDKTLFSLEEQLDAKDARDVRFPEQEHLTHELAVVHDYDDASAHLILTATSQHLPKPGIEQVFESLSAPKQFVRERSKLTREERIRLAKEHRERGTASAVSGLERREQPSQVREGWGPGGEVVQELKDVIWKVGEQRRKMAGRSTSPPP